jgi:Tol biopolymer transport system component
MTSRGARLRPLFKSCNVCDDPDYSPDGRYIAFSVAGGGAIDLASASGTGRHRLHKGGGTQPAWSPSGRFIAYTRDGEIYVSRYDGTDPHRVRYDARHRVGDDVTGEYGEPSWQPLPRR